MGYARTIWSYTWSLQLLVNGGVISIREDGLGGVGSLSDDAGDLLGNLLGSRLGSFLSALGGLLSLLDNLGLDLLGLGDAIDADELRLEDYRFTKC